MLPSKYRAVEKHMAVLEFSVLGKLNTAQDKTGMHGEVPSEGVEEAGPPC